MLRSDFLAMLAAYAPVRASGVANNPNIIKSLASDLSALMVQEVNKVSTETKEKEAILEIFQSELKVKVQSLYKDSILNESEKSQYSTLAENIIRVQANSLYASFIKCCNLCLQALGQEEMQFIDYPLFKTHIKSFFEQNNIAVSKEEYEKQLEKFVPIFNEILYTCIYSWDMINDYSMALDKCVGLRDLANVVIETFISIIEYSKEYEEILLNHKEEHQIIKAISETLVMKIENIKDGLESFLDEIKTMSYSANSLDICDIALQQWHNAGDMTPVLAEDFFKGLQNHPEIQQKLAKSVNSKMQALGKQEMFYKKNQLLFEITTFNDLLNYSIARLKESTEIDVLMYIQVVEEANSMINTTLVNYDIRPVNPSPHTVFNGKEHEVIMTQSQEGFKKGEIIKVSNQGYHQRGIVIVRASVIVAR